MNVFITNIDGSMYVCGLHGVCYVTWVSAKDKKQALAFPLNNIDTWIKLISDMTGIECIATSPRRPGQL